MGKRAVPAGILRNRSGAAGCLPQTQPEIKVLLDAFTLEKGLMEVEYELQYRPDWVRIPLHGILEQLQ